MRKPMARWRRSGGIGGIGCHYRVMLHGQQVEIADDLLFAIIEDLKILAVQRPDRLAAGIADHYTH